MLKQEFTSNAHCCNKANKANKSAFLRLPQLHQDVSKWLHVAAQVPVHMS